jgi:hypothetical protein
MLIAPSQARSAIMTSLAAVRERLTRADDLPVLLDAAYEAFEVLLSVLEDHEDPDDPRFTAFVMAATCAANGRDAILFTPSLPPRQLPRPPGGNGAVPPAGDNGVADVVAVSALLAARLDQTAGQASSPGDQAGCQNAAHWAREIHRMTSGGP